MDETLQALSPSELTEESPEPTTPLSSNPKVIVEVTPNGFATSVDHRINPVTLMGIGHMLIRAGSNVMDQAEAQAMARAIENQQLIAGLTGKIRA